jgi:prefoldin subunit 5
MTDDTRDIVIELRSEVATLKKSVETLELMVKTLLTALQNLEKKEAADQAQRTMLVWIGAAIIAAAGGMGAIMAKLAGWVTVAVNK